MISFRSLFSSRNKPLKIDNKFLTAIVAENYADHTDHNNDDVLFLIHRMENDLESIFSIDHVQDLTIQPNAQTIKEFEPVERLSSRLRSINEDSQDPGFGWKNFTIIKKPQELIFKGFKAADAIFTVEESVGERRRIIKKKIRRMVIFTENDLWNFVLSPSEVSNYESEMNLFNDILESIKIKK